MSCEIDLSHTNVKKERKNSNKRNYIHSNVDIYSLIWQRLEMLVKEMKYILSTIDFDLFVVVENYCLHYIHVLLSPNKFNKYHRQGLFVEFFVFFQFSNNVYWD